MNRQYSRDKLRTNDNYNDRNYDRKSRVKNINKNEKTNFEEYEEKFNYANMAAELLDKDDIKISEDIEKDACDSFDDMGGEKGLKENLLRGIYAYGFEKPSLIQSRAIPVMIKGRELLAQAQSGTGKTGAFTTAALELIDEDLHQPQVIIISPTCELADQTNTVEKNLAIFMPKIKTSLTVGGTDRSQNIKELGGGFQMKSNEDIAQLVIATPGRLMDMIKDKELPNLIDNIKLLVIDECDELLSGSFKEDLKEIITALSKKNNNLKICLFSATLTDNVVRLADLILDNPAKILIKKEKMTLDGIKQRYIEVANPNDKINVLIEMLQILPINQFIVYVNSKKNAEILQNYLEEQSYSVLIITSSMSKFDRAEIIRQVKKGSIKCLISTDLLSRGIDIQQLSLVINYDLPKPDNIQNYIHRIGRTGRYGRNGLSINLISKHESEIQTLISLTFKCAIEPLEKDFIKYI